MNQNKPLPRPPSHYFIPIYNNKDNKTYDKTDDKTDDKCEEEKLLEPIKVLKPKVKIPSLYLKSAKVYPEPMFGELNNLTTNST